MFENREVDPELAREILALEIALARRDPTAIPGGLEAVLDDAFIEHGAAGRRWDRRATIDTIAGAPPMAAVITEFAVASLSDDVILVTYLVRRGEPGQASRRSSIWVRRGDTWRLRFHQGTPVDD